MDNPFEGDLDPTGKDFVSVFGSPNNVVIKVVDRCSAICKSVCIFHTNDYTIIHVSHIRPSGVKKKGGQFITFLKERVSLPLFKNDLANRYIADYLGNCQQYEQNDKTFKGFSSIKDITYLRDNKIKIDVNDDIYQLPKARRSLLIQDLQNGVYGTLADNDLKKLSEKDIQKGRPTTVYLNGKVIGHTAKNDNHHIIWDK